MNLTDLQSLSQMRLREAHALLATGNPCGAYYFAGYAVECAIKACIAKQTQQGDFPDKQRGIDVFDHSPEKLIRTAELKTEFEQEFKTNPAFAYNWTLVGAWRVEKRYATHTIEHEVVDLIEAIENPQNGVLSWLRKHW